MEGFVSDVRMVLQTILKLYFIVHEVKLPFKKKVRFVMLLCSALWTTFRPHFVRNNINLYYQSTNTFMCEHYMLTILSYIGHLSLYVCGRKKRTKYQSNMCYWINNDYIICFLIFNRLLDMLHYLLRPSMEHLLYKQDIVSDAEGYNFSGKVMLFESITLLTLTVRIAKCHLLST